MRATFKLVKQQQGKQHAQWEVNRDVTILRTDRVRAGVHVSIPLIKGMLEKSNAKLLIVEGCAVSRFNRGFLKYMVEDTDFKVWS